ncbi:MAG: replication-relaxation family protein, partial [Candidatus Saccharibacteria bacterium]
MLLPKLTPKQQTILTLLYTYRFLNRIQIQRLMGHKDYKRINVWLADLRDHDYVQRIYSTDFLEKSKPAIYYLGLNGIRWLKQHQDHPTSEYPKRYRESSRTPGFIDQCLLVADSCLALNQKSADSSQTSYSYATQADYADPSHVYHFLSESELISPLLCHQKIEEIDGEREATTYLLEVIEATMPRYRLRKRLKNYIEYLDNGEWQYETDAAEPNPIILFICPTLVELIYCKRATKRLLEETWDEDIRLWFTTTDKLKTQGFISPIWDEVRPMIDD